MNKSMKKIFSSFTIPIIIIAIAACGASIAFASLTFTGTNITGDANAIIDTAGTVSIGTSTATGITIGRTGVTTTIAGSIKASGLVLTDIPAFVICNAVGCADTQTVNNWFVSSPTGITFDECGADIAVAPTVQTVKVDIQTPGGVSIFTAPISLTVANGTATVFNSVFTNPTAVKGAQFKAVITQGDTGGAGQFVYIKCRTHTN